ncbi:MAG: tetratricopeptide repeat protein [Chlamydiales bacterium]
MKKILLCLAILFVLPISAAYTQVGGIWSNELYAPTGSVQEHYDMGMRKLRDKDYEEALRNFLIVVHHFPDSTFYADAIYFTGVTYYFLGHFDLADQQFSRYLRQRGTLKCFESVFEFKYAIAQYFHEGKKKHPFGIKTLPRMAPARNDAIRLYDEIIATLPSKDIAAQSLFSKARLLRARKEFKQSIEIFQTLHRRFPKHPLAADSYEQIAEIYVDQTRLEAQNPDFLALAQINLQNFQKAFPSDERIYVLKACMQQMNEIYASSLYDTGRFYERKGKTLASRIYYGDAIRKYPSTNAAEKCQKRIARFDHKEKKSTV